MALAAQSFAGHTLDRRFRARPADMAGRGAASASSRLHRRCAGSRCRFDRACVQRVGRVGTVQAFAPRRLLFVSSTKGSSTASLAAVRQLSRHHRRAGVDAGADRPVCVGGRIGRPLLSAPIDPDARRPASRRAASPSSSWSCWSRWPRPRRSPARCWCSPCSWCPPLPHSGAARPGSGWRSPSLARDRVGALAIAYSSPYPVGFWISASLSACTAPRMPRPCGARMNLAAIADAGPGLATSRAPVHQRCSRGPPSPRPAASSASSSCAVRCSAPMP